MNLRAFAFTTLACTTSALLAAEAVEDAKKSRFREMVAQKMIEDAKKNPPPPAPPAAKDATPVTAPVAPATQPAPTTAKNDAEAAKQAPAAVMPKVEVRRDRITILDQKLAVQEKEIAREKVNTKPTELDKALNDSRLVKPLSIFGGESAEQRATVAQDRVDVMESEKDLIEAIAYARTKEQKAELQKQLDELRMYRRELEKSLR